MSFLFPNLLYALGLVAIPLIIHFFNFQRAQRVYFTNVAFLKTVKEVTNSRNKLKHLLILAMRILFIACVVIAFAQPFIPQEKAADSQESGGNLVSIYLDNSYSLQQEKDNKSLLNWAVGYAEQLPEVFSKQIRYQLVDNNLSGNGRFFYEGDKLMDKLAGYPYSNTGLDLSRAYDRQLKSLEGQPTPKGNQLFWISDFQKEQVGDLDAIGIDTAQSLYIMPLAPNRNSNLYIDSVWLENPFVKVQENNFLHVRVVNFGSDDQSDKVVKLFLEGNQVSSGTLSLPAGGTEEIRLNFAVNETGSVKGRIALEDYPVLFDNEHHFVLRVAPEINIVSIVAGGSAFIEQVFAAEPFFRVRRFGVESLDYAALNTADLIVLQGLNQIDPSLLSPLNKALERGASLAVFPGVAFDPSSYGTLLSLPIKKGQAKQKLPVQAPDPQQPFFSGVFEEVSPNMSMPDAAPLMSWGTAGQSLLRFKTSTPFLSRLEKGKGRLYLFASPLDKDFSNFSQHAVFVPTMYKLALSSKASSERLSYGFDEDLAAVKLPEGVKQQEVFKLKMGALELIPEQRISNDELVLTIPKEGLEAGVYELRSSQSDELFGQVAFNYSNEESKLECYSLDELRSHFAQYPNVTVFDQVDTEGFAKAFSSSYASQPIWRYFVIAALLFLLGEIALIRFWKE